MQLRVIVSVSMCVCIGMCARVCARTCGGWGGLALLSVLFGTSLAGPYGATGRDQGWAPGQAASSSAGN